MPITIGNSIVLARAQRALDDASRSYAKSAERLSSGLRINSAADDAAGLSVATALKSQTTSFSRGIRNLTDGMSFLNTAEEAAEELTSILTRIQELAAQAANTTFTPTQRITLNTESTALVEEYNRIIATTSFNGTNVFAAESLSLQASAGQSGILNLGLGGATSRSTNDGTFNLSATIALPFVSYVGANQLFDLNGDGNLDYIATTDLTPGAALQIAFGNGNGTFGPVTSYSNAGDFSRGFSIGDIDGDGDADIVAPSRSGNQIGIFTNNGSGSFTRTSVAVTEPHNTELYDLDGDGDLDIVATDRSTGKINVLLGSGTGTFGAAVSYNNDGGEDLRLADVNGDGHVDALAVGQYGNFLNITYGNGNGTFNNTTTRFNLGGGAFGLEVGDVNGDGRTDVIVSMDNSIAILHGNGNGTFALSQSLVSGAAGNSDSNKYKVYLGDVTGDRIDDIVDLKGAGNSFSIFAGNGNGTFKTRTTINTGSGTVTLAAGDINGDGATDFIAGVSDINTFALVYLGGAQTISESRQLTAIDQFDLTTASSASAALTDVQAQLDAVSNYLGVVGAHISRVNSAVDLNETLLEMTRAAYDKIMDADIASELAENVRSAVLQQAATAMLAQANQSAKSVLKLLV